MRKKSIKLGRGAIPHTKNDIHITMPRKDKRFRRGSEESSFKSVHEDIHDQRRKGSAHWQPIRKFVKNTLIETKVIRKT